MRACGTWGGVDESVWDLAVSTFAWSADLSENSNKQANELRGSLVPSPGFSPALLRSLLPLTQILKLRSDESDGPIVPPAYGVCPFAWRTREGQLTCALGTNMKTAFRY